MNEIADALDKIAESLAGEVRNATSNAHMSELLDAHGEAVKFASAIRNDIPVSIDAVEAFMERARELAKR